MSKHSSQVSSESQCTAPSFTDQSHVRPTPTSHSKQKHGRLKSTRHTAAFPCHQPFSDCSPDPASQLSSVREIDVPGDDNSDTDLSESERLSELTRGVNPPQLELRQDVTAPEDPPLSCRNKSKTQFDFPDFLPPPFNSWSLSQLAFFYNKASRTKPAGTLERYLERLLQIELYQTQTWKDNNRTTHADPMSSSHRSLESTSSRLSTPKCILQCQRAFPVSFLSPVPSHCAYIVCRPRNSSCCCRSSPSQSRPSRFSPTQEHRAPTSLPKRSYSESRVPSFDPSHRLSPVRAQGHINHMQAAGNIRTSVQGANNRLLSTARDPARARDPEGRDAVPDYRSGGVRRSGSEHRKTNVEQSHRGSEKRRGRSECRKGRAERRAQQEIKPDAVTAIMDNLPATKYAAVNRPVRSKVEFIT